MADYIPNEEAALVIWFADHAAGVNTHGATVGRSAGEIAQAAEDAASVAHAVNGRSLYESKKQELTAYKDILLYAPLNTPLPGTPAPPAVGGLGLGALAACVARARQRAERIKAHPAYTPAIGEDCRIVAPAVAHAAHAQGQGGDRFPGAPDVRDARPRPDRDSVAARGRDGVGVAGVRHELSVH